MNSAVTTEVELPETAYGWQVSQFISAGDENKRLYAVYKHKTADAWLAIATDDITNTHYACLFTTEMDNKSLQTAAECFISLVSQKVTALETPLILLPTQHGGDDDASDFLTKKIHSTL